MALVAPYPIAKRAPAVRRAMRQGRSARGGRAGDGAKLAICLVSVLCAGEVDEAVARPLADFDRDAAWRHDQALPVLVSQDVREESSLNLLRQKIALLDAYLASRAIQDIEQEDAAPAADLVAEARRVLTSVRSSITAGERWT